MEKEEFLKKLERVFEGLPSPLVEPVWYPEVPGQKRVIDYLVRLGILMRELAETLARLIKDEALFDENPLILVYPNYPEASGIVIFHKGKRVYEKWVKSFELNFGERQEQRREPNNWRNDMPYNHVPYDEVPFGMSPEEYDFLYGPPWERRW